MNSSAGKSLRKILNLDRPLAALMSLSIVVAFGYQLGKDAAKADNQRDRPAVGEIQN